MGSHVTADYNIPKTPTVWHGVCLIPFFNDTEHLASRLLLITREARLSQSL